MFAVLMGHAFEWLFTPHQDDPVTKLAELSVGQGWDWEGHAETSKNCQHHDTPWKRSKTDALPSPHS